MNESVTQRGGDNAKTSHWLAPSLTKANVMTKMALDANFKANFNGEFTSSPLFLAGATPGTGRFFAATTENDVYAFDEMTGAVLTGWPHNIGGYLVSAPVSTLEMSTGQPATSIPVSVESAWTSWWPSVMAAAT